MKKFFPNCVNSPGGTERLVPARNTNSTTVEGVEKMEKMLSRDFLEHSAKNLIKNVTLSRTNTQHTAKIHNKTSSPLSHIAVGQSELSAGSNQPITSQDRARDWE